MSDFGSPTNPRNPNVALGVVWAETGAAIIKRLRQAGLDPNTASVAAQITLAVGGDETMVRTLHIPIAIAAVVAALAAGAIVRDPLLGMTIAAVASLVILPITWYHYPVALIPFGIAAAARSVSDPARARALPLIVGAIIIASLSIAWVPGVWIAVAILLVAVATSRPTPEPDA